MSPVDQTTMEKDLPPLPPAPTLPPRPSFSGATTGPIESPSTNAPGSSSSSRTQYADDTKDPHYLPFLDTRSSPAEAEAEAPVAPPYSALDPNAPSPTSTLTGTYVSRYSEAPTVQEIAEIKRADGSGSGSYTGSGAGDGGADRRPPASSRASRGAEETGPTVAAGATATNDGNIQVEIDVRSQSRFFRDLSALGIPRPRQSATEGADFPAEGAEEGSKTERRRSRSGWTWGRRRRRRRSETGNGQNGVDSPGQDLTPRGSLSLNDAGPSRRTSTEPTDSLDLGGKQVDAGVDVDAPTGSGVDGDGTRLKTKKDKGKGKDKDKGKDKGKGKGKLPSSSTGVDDGYVPPMSIVIFIVGSRGDVQPYLALALALIIHAGHRVRLATHPDFRQFVLSANSRLRGKTHNGVPLEGRLEFFDAGGNPKELMAYMVKNPGLLPGIESLTNGDIKRKRDMSAEYLRGFYRSTFSPDVVSGREFAADAIISNPPAFAHIHVAEALGIPLLMSFTMPWTATTAFPHPLVNVKKSNADDWATNWMGYHLADMLMWEGLGGVINTFRTEILRLEEIPDRVASSVIDNLRIPWTYCWSPELLPKPRDWKSHIDISGFYFLDGEDAYVPPTDLAAFLADGAAPVYIGFGSVVIQDPEQMTDTIFQAVADAGVRAIISAGWAGLGKGKEGTNKDIFILTKDCPHEWLFANDRVAAVCHHGGAGTTACGLRHGRPTIIVPFFGDQKFWGDAVHNAGAGPAAIPIKTLTTENITAALQFAVSEEAVQAAGILGEKIRSEKGEERGVRSFARHMPLDDMYCDVDPRKVAVWWHPKSCLKLSVDAAAALVSAQRMMFSDLEPYRSQEHDVTFHNRGPISGTGGGLSNLFSTALSGPAQLFYSPVRGTIRTFYGIPAASLGVVGDMYEGFDNVSRFAGSTSRPKAKVTDWKSGFAEGGKAIGWGIYDGITGLFTDPVDGAIREGAAGFGKGLGRGMVGLTFRPLAGTLGLFVLPTRGIRASVKASLGQHQDPHSVLRGPREALTREAIRSLVAEDKARMLDTFAVLEQETAERKNKAEKTKWLLIATKAEREKEKIERQRMRLEKEERKAMKARQGAQKAESQPPTPAATSPSQVEPPRVGPAADVYK